MLVLGMPDEGKVRVKNEREGAGHAITFSVSFRAERGTSQKVVDHTKKDVRCMIVRTIRFRNNSPQSTTVRSLVVCATRDDRLIRRDSG